MLSLPWSRLERGTGFDDLLWVVCRKNFVGRVELCLLDLCEVCCRSTAMCVDEQESKRNQTRKNEGDDHDDHGSQGAGGSGNDSDCLVEYS